MERHPVPKKPSRSVFSDARWPTRISHAGLGVLLSLAVDSCQSEQAAIGPLVRINLKQLPSSASKVSLKVSAQGEDKSSEFTNAPLDLLGVTFQPGTTGQAQLDVQVFDASGCLISKGQASISVAGWLGIGSEVLAEKVVEGRSIGTA